MTDKDNLLIAVVFGIILGVILSANLRPVYLNYSNPAIDTYPLDEDPNCIGCYIHDDMQNVFVGTFFTVHLSNLTINKTYVILLQQDPVLFIAQEQELFFYSTAQDTADHKIIISLFESHTKPFFIKIGQGFLDTLTYLDRIEVNLVDKSV